MTSPCLHYDCENKNSFGYCKTSACIHPKYRQQTVCGTYNETPRVVIKSTIEPQRWIPFKTRPLTEEEKEENSDWDCFLDCKVPDDGQAILVSINLRGHESVQYDEFYKDCEGCYLGSGYEIGDEAVAWMPLPEPYKGEAEA